MNICLKKNQAYFRTLDPCRWNLSRFCIDRICTPGIVNLLVASAPLLKPGSHSVLLTSFMASVQTLHLHEDMEAFYQKLFCMPSQAAAILLGMNRVLTPVSRI